MSGDNTTPTTATLNIKTVSDFPAGTSINMVLYGQDGSTYKYYDWQATAWKAVEAGKELSVFTHQTTATDAGKAVVSLEVPYLSGARLYVCYGTKPSIKGNSGGGISQPSPWKEHDSLHTCMVDKVEFTTRNNSGLYELNMNTTCVDFFSIPLQYTISGYAGAGTSTPKATYSAGITSNRKDLYNDISSDPIFLRLCQRPDGGGDTDFYRILSPDTSIAKNVDNFPTDFFDSYIEHCWTKVFTTAAGAPTIELVNINPNAVPVGVPTKKYSGKMVNQGGANVLQFTCSKATVAGGSDFVPVANVTIAQPNTSQAVQGTIVGQGSTLGSGTQADVNDAIGFLTAQLSAAICRTCLHVLDDNAGTSKVWATYNNFYKQKVAAFRNDPDNGYSNDVYSMVLHNHSLDHKCYSSPYSDQYDYSTFKAVFNPTQWDVMLGF